MKEKIDLIVKINDYLNANLIQKNLHLSDLYSLLRYLNFNNTSDGLAVRIVLEPEPKLEISTWDRQLYRYRILCADMSVWRWWKTSMMYFQ